MSIKTWPRKKKLTLSLLLAAALVVCGTCVVFFLQSQDHALFHFKPSSVESITFWHGSGGSMEITDRGQIDQAIQLLNEFTYDETKELPPMGGWSYSLTVAQDDEVFRIGFGASYIRLWWDDDSSTFYAGPAGHFQTLVDLGEEAHERFLTDND